MPEMPEVQGLVDFLAERTTARFPERPDGLTIEKASLASIAALKTFDPPLTALVGARIVDASRHGKFVDLTAITPSHEALHLVFHLARAGWLRWYEQLPTTVIRPGRTPIALRIALSDGSGFDLTEAGTKKSLAISVVRNPADVPGIARLGPDPLADDFTEPVLAAILSGRRTQIKGVLREQSVIAGIGNAYSDEILHAARMSPYAALRATLAEAVAEASGHPPAELKDAKRRGMQVHARSGQACPVCGDTVRDVFFAERSLQYCPTCQTGGKLLADRRLSRLLK